MVRCRSIITLQVDAFCSQAVLPRARWLHTGCTNAACARQMRLVHLPLGDAARAHVAGSPIHGSAALLLVLLTSRREVGCGAAAALHTRDLRLARTPATLELHVSRTQVDPESAMQPRALVAAETGECVATAVQVRLQQAALALMTCLSFYCRRLLYAGIPCSIGGSTHVALSWMQAILGC